MRSGDPKRPILERGASRDWLISRLHSGDPMRPILEWCFLRLGSHGMGGPGVGNPGAGSHGVKLFRTGESGPGVGSHGVVGLLKTGESWSGGSWSGESRSGGSWGGASKASGQFGLENRTSLMILCWRQQDWHQNPKTKKKHRPQMIFSEPRLGDMSDSHRVPPDGWDQMAPIRKHVSGICYANEGPAHPRNPARAERARRLSWEPLAREPCVC